MPHEEYMRLAIAEAEQGIREGQTPFGACILRDGKVIARAHNAVWEHLDITAHAEILAIREACATLGEIDLSGSTIYSTCEPCPMCFSAIHWARIPRVVYGASIADAEESGFNELQISNRQLKSLGKMSTEIITDILREECRELFRVWETTSNNRAY